VHDAAAMQPENEITEKLGRLEIPVLQSWASLMTALS